MTFWDTIVDNERFYDRMGERAMADAQQPHGVFVGTPIRDWERDLHDGQLIPINGWWFRVAGVVREKQPNGALVLEPTGERTGPRRVPKG